VSRRVTRAELARHLKVNRATVTKWVKAGRLKLGADGRVDLEDALRQLETSESPMPHHQARKAAWEAEKGSHGGKASQNPPQGAGEAVSVPNLSDVSLRLKIAAAREREAKAERAIMEAEQMAGNLVKREDVEYVLRDFGTTLRGLVEQLPDRLSAELAGHGGDVHAIHVSLEEAARDLLDEIAQAMQRKRFTWNRAEAG